MTTVGRSQVIVPDLAAAGGPTLKTNFDAMIKTMSDNAATRYQEYVNVNNAATVELNHNLGVNLDEMTIILYTGAGLTKVQVIDTANYAIVEKTGAERATIEVTNNTGGQVDLVIGLVDFRLSPSQAYQLLAAAPASPRASTVVAWFAGDGRSLKKNSAGVISPLNTLAPVHITDADSPVTAVLGVHYIADTTSGPITITLPATIQDYDAIQASDAKKTFGTNNLTIGRNTNSVDNEAIDFVFSTSGGGGLFIGDNTNSNWVLSSSGAGGGSGEGGINYFQNGSFETNVTEGVTTGGTVAPTVSAETAAPLFGSQSAKVTSGNNTGFVDFALEDIDNGVVDSGTSTLVTGYFKTDSSGAAGDWTVGIYDTVGAAYVTEQTDLEVDIINIHRTPFVPLFTTAGRYKLRLEHTVTTNAQVVTLDKLVDTPDSNSGLVAFEQKTVEVDDSVLDLVTASSALTGPPTTVLSARAISYFDGSTYRLKFNVSYTTTGAVTLTKFAFTGVSLPSTKSYAVSSACDAGGATVGDTQQAGPNIVGTGASTTGWRFSGDIPIDAKPPWFDDNLDNNKVNLLTQDVITANSRAGHHVTSNFAYTGGDKVPFATEDYNDGGGFTPDGAFENFTCNFNGLVSVDANVNVLTNDAPAAARIETSVNAGVVDDGVGGNTTLGLKATTVVKVVVGDTISVKALSLTKTITTASKLKLTRGMDYGAFDPVGFALATAQAAGLIPRYQTEEIDISSSGSFTSGTLILTRIGNLVTIGIKETSASHSSGVEGFTANGLIPADYAPATTAKNVYGIASLEEYQVTVTSIGSFRTEYRDTNTGANLVKTTTVVRPTITYQV